MYIWLRCNHGDIFNSWNVVYKALHKALVKEGAVVYIGDSAPENVGRYIELWWGDIADWKWSKHNPLFRVGFALSEAQSFLSASRNAIIKNIKRCDMILCPSEFASRAFREAPIDVPIEIVFFGIDSSITFFERKWEYPINFLVAGAAQFRKGTSLAIDAFLRFSKYYDNSILTIWSTVRTPMREKLFDEFNESKNIIFDFTFYDDIQVLYRQHDVLISPHLSEGFGLIIPEAMATGMPCIVSRVSSPREFFDKRYGWWIEMSDMYAPVSKCLCNTGGVWRLPDIDSLVECMEDAYNNPFLCAEKGKLASEYVKNDLTWSHTAKNILRILS